MKTNTIFFFLIIFIQSYLVINSNAQNMPIISHKEFSIQLKQKYPKSFSGVNFPDTFYFKNIKTGTEDYFTINTSFSIEMMVFRNQQNFLDLNHDGEKEILYTHQFEEYKGAISIFQIKQGKYVMLDFFPLPPADRYLIFHEMKLIQLKKNYSILKLLVSNDYPTINPKTGLRGLTSERTLFLFDFIDNNLVPICVYSIK